MPPGRAEGPAPGCGQVAVKIRKWKKCEPWSQTDLDLNSSFDIWLLLGKVLNFSVPQFSSLQNKNNNTYFAWWLRRLCKMMYKLDSSSENE